MSASRARVGLSRSAALLAAVAVLAAAPGCGEKEEPDLSTVEATTPTVTTPTTPTTPAPPTTTAP